MASIINNDTGEIIEENEENYALAKKEINQLVIIDQWLEKKEALETAKEQFEMVDKPFRTIIKQIFDKYQIKQISNDYIDILQKNGYKKKQWDDDKLIEFIYQNKRKPEEFQDKKWINGSLQIKYKE